MFTRSFRTPSERWRSHAVSQPTWGDFIHEQRRSIEFQRGIVGERQLRSRKSFPYKFLINHFTLIIL